jgi:hypothetical protein
MRAKLLWSLAILFLGTSLTGLAKPPFAGAEAEKPKRGGWRWGARDKGKGKEKAEKAGKEEKEKAEKAEKTKGGGWWRRDKDENDVDKKAKEAKEKAEKEKKGRDKQVEKKAEQVQTDADKGSEKGKEARAKRKRWWQW